MAFSFSSIICLSTELRPTLERREKYLGRSQQTFSHRMIDGAARSKLAPIYGYSLYDKRLGYNFIFEKQFEKP